MRLTNYYGVRTNKECPDGFVRLITVTEFSINNVHLGIHVRS
jgi:hypothetical protein